MPDARVGTEDGEFAKVVAGGVGEHGDLLRLRVELLLLQRKAQPNIGHDRQTHTALDFAEMQGHAECITLLEPFRLPTLEELVSCLEKGDVPVLEKWVVRGGDVNHHFTAQMPEGRAQVPLLVYAAMKGQDAVVEWLLGRRADPDAAISGDPQPTDADGHTPLMRACIAKNCRPFSEPCKKSVHETDPSNLTFL